MDNATATKIPSFRSVCNFAGLINGAAKLINRTREGYRPGQGGSIPGQEREGVVPNRVVRKISGRARSGVRTQLLGYCTMGIARLWISKKKQLIKKSNKKTVKKSIFDGSNKSFR